jgi:hypothetical protein
VAPALWEPVGAGRFSFIIIARIKAGGALHDPSTVSMQLVSSLVLPAKGFT